MHLSISNLTKQYKGGKFGLRDFSLEIDNGILGLLGPNGAGKSTLMRVIATITQPTAGQIRWNDIDVAKDPNALRRVLGYLPQDFGVYPNLTAYEFLEYLAAIKGLGGHDTRRRIEALLEEVNLSHVRNKAIGTFSGGMRQRIGIAQTLLNDPQLLIMDEPTVGLDPEERVRFRNLLSDLSGDRIVILSSHIVSDLETVASDIAIINHGTLVIHDFPHEMLQTVDNRVFEANLTQEELPIFKQKYQVINVMRRQNGWHVRFINESSLAVHASQVAVKATLEDAYLWYVATKHPLAHA